MHNKTELLGVKGSWREVVDDCRATVSKESLGHEPSGQFKRSILIAEHSPIRDIRVRWRWRDILSWVATHWSRHKWECFIRTQRSDRTGIPRGKLPQEAPVTFTGEANAQSLIDTWRKRLCYQASPELSDVLVPNCVYRGGCPELEPCGFWERFCPAEGTIQDRYDQYNALFYERREGRDT